MSERPIFIVGSPRSGTTMLRDLLRSHSRLTFPEESGVLPALHRCHGDPADDRAARRLARDLLASAGIAAWRLGLDPDTLRHHRSFAGIAGALYEDWARRQGKPRWGDKTPLYAAELPTVMRLFPAAQVVHIIRDGRDVVASLERQPWGPTNAYTAARLWRRAVSAGRTEGRRLPGDAYREVRYESLVADPQTTLRELCDFLGERFEPAILRLDRILPPGGRQAPWPTHHALTIDPSAAGSWRRCLSASDRRVITAVAGGLLAELGYVDQETGRLPGAAARLLAHGRDGLGFARWRLTTWDRGPRARQSVVLARARLRRIARQAVAAAAMVQP
jgi:hypothetical protein